MQLDIPPLPCFYVLIPYFLIKYTHFSPHSYVLTLFISTAVPFMDTEQFANTTHTTHITHITSHNIKTLFILPHFLATEYFQSLHRLGHDSLRVVHDAVADGCGDSGGHVRIVTDNVVAGRHGVTAEGHGRLGHC